MNDMIRPTLEKKCEGEQDTRDRVNITCDHDTNCPFITGMDQMNIDNKVYLFTRCQFLVYLILFLIFLPMNGY